MTSTGRTVEQTSHQLVCEALRETVRAGPGAIEGVGSIRYRASALLYLLLLQHPVDEHGRCRSCPGVMTGLRPRPCRIHLKASDWLLHHPDDALLLSHLARELGASRVPPGSAAGRRQWPGLIVRTRTDPSQTPAVPFPLPPRDIREAGRPDPTHGGTGVHPGSPRFRRVPPPDGQSPSPGRSL